MPDALEPAAATTKSPPQPRPARSRTPSRAAEIVVAPPKPRRVLPADDETAANELRGVTVVAFGVARKILALEPEPGTKDYAKIIATQGAVALGVLNLKARIDTAALRTAHDEDVLGQILKRIHEHDAKALERAPAVVIEQPPEPAR